MRSHLSLPTLLLGFVLVLAACDSAGPAATSSVRYSVSGPAAVTYTDASGASATTTTDAAWSTEVAVSGGTPVALAATSATGDPVTVLLRVDGKLVAARRGRSVRVESVSRGRGDDDGDDDDDDDDDEAEVRGPIESITADQVVVAGLAFTLTPSTRLRDASGSVTTLAAFAVGTYVEVEGVPTGTDTFRATSLKIEDDDDDGTEVEVQGAITALDAASVTVRDRRFVTTDQTRYLDDRNVPIARSAFAVGDLVEAEGHVRADGTLVAEKVKRDDD